MATEDYMFFWDYTNTHLIQYWLNFCTLKGTFQGISETLAYCLSHLMKRYPVTERILQPQPQVALRQLPDPSYWCEGGLCSWTNYTWIEIVLLTSECCFLQGGDVIQTGQQMICCTFRKLNHGRRCIPSVLLHLCITLSSCLPHLSYQTNQLVRTLIEIESK
jgi:hypothetical protein